MKFANEWEHFKKQIGVTVLMPIVQKGKLSPESKIKAEPPFKIPTVLNADGYVVGLAKWAKKVTSRGQASVWQAKGFGLGIRTGHELPSGGYLVGVDVDIENERTQERVYDALVELTGEKRLHYRHRGNGRRLYMIAVNEQPIKHVLETRRGNIDLLGLGQQFVAAGKHPSGEMYQWESRLPRRFPVVEWADLVEAITQSARVKKITKDDSGTDYDESDDEDIERAREHFAELIEWLDDNSEREEDGKYYFTTPDDSLYSSPSHDGDFVVMKPGRAGYALPIVKLVHSSDIEAAGESEKDKFAYFCDMFDVPEFKRSYKKFVRAFKKRSKTTRDDFEDVEEPEEATPTNIINPDDRPIKKVKAELEEMKDSERAYYLRKHYGKVRRDADSKMVHVFDGAVWGMRSEDKLEYDLTRIYNESAQAFDMKDIKGAVKALAASSTSLPPEPQNLIGFANGVFDMSSRDFRQYEPEDFLRTHNGITWTKKKKRERLEKHAPNFHKWLMWAVDDDEDKAARLLAALFMILARRYDWQLFIEVTGVGGSGKSVFTEIASMLVGRTNVGVGGSDTMASPAARVNLIGKAVITMPEETGKRTGGEMIKKITGGDPINFNPKFLPAFDQRLYGVILCTNNTPMKFVNDNGGIARRRVLFSFNKQVPHAERDARLPAKIEGELPVIVRHLFETFAEADTARELLEEQRTSDEAQEIAQESDPLAQFIALLEFTRCARQRANVMWNARADSTPIMRRHVYETYKTFCELTGVRFIMELGDFRSTIKNAMRDAGVPYCYRRSNGVDYINIEFNEKSDAYFADYAPE